MILFIGRFVMIRILANLIQFTIKSIYKFISQAILLFLILNIGIGKFDSGVRAQPITITHLLFLRSFTAFLAIATVSSQL
jgi:hypothetical protein